MFDKDIPGSNCIREKLFMYLFDLHIISRKVLRMFPLNKPPSWEVVCLLGKRESSYVRLHIR